MYKSLKKNGKHTVSHNQSAQHKNKVWNILRVKNKHTTFEHISHHTLVFLLLTLNRQMPIENFHVLVNFQVPKYSLCILQKTDHQCQNANFQTMLLFIFLKVFYNHLYSVLF